MTGLPVGFDTGSHAVSVHVKVPTKAFSTCSSPTGAQIAAYFSFCFVTVLVATAAHDSRVNAGTSQLLIPLIEFRMVAVVRAAWQQTERHACSNQKDFHLFSLMLAAAHKDKCRWASSVAKRKRDKHHRATRATDRAETSGVVWSPRRAIASRL